MGQTNDRVESKMSCQEALKNVHNVKIGMKDAEIIELIGIPTAKLDERWNYNFLECAKPIIGAQIVVGVSLLLKENVVAEINWATLCTMGSYNVNPPKKKKKQKYNR